MLQQMPLFPGTCIRSAARIIVQSSFCNLLPSIGIYLFFLSQVLKSLPDIIDK